MGGAGAGGLIAGTSILSSFFDIFSLTSSWNVTRGGRAVADGRGGGGGGLGTAAVVLDSDNAGTDGRDL
jgi:hypothetical protein